MTKCISTIFVVYSFGCLFIYENAFLHIFKCYCIVYIISIRQMKPCLGWSGSGCGEFKSLCKWLLGFSLTGAVWRGGRVLVGLPGNPYVPFHKSSTKLGGNLLCFLSFGSVSASSNSEFCLKKTKPVEIWMTERAIFFLTNISKPMIWVIDVPLSAFNVIKMQLMSCKRM